MFNSRIHEGSKKILNECSGYIGHNKLVSATGAHGLVFSKQNPEFKNILDSFYINLPDGMPSVWIGRLKGAKRMERCYGPDFFQKIMLESANMTIKHYLCGGIEGVAEKLKISCQEKFNNSNSSSFIE